MQSLGADSEGASKTAAAWCGTWAISPSRLVSPATTPRWYSHAAPRSPAGISAPCCAGVLAYVELNRCGWEIPRELGWESCLPDDLLAASCYRNVTWFSLLLPSGLISVVLSQQRFEASLMLWAWKS